MQGSAMRSSSPSFALSNLEKHRSLSLRRRTFRYVYVMEAAKGHQLRVPEDIAVVGFDGIPAAKVDRAVTNDRASTHCGEGALGRVGSSLLKEKGRFGLSYLRRLLFASLRPAILGSAQETEIDVR
jgi:hypothetical protein